MNVQATTTIPGTALSTHTRLRMAQRGLSEADVNYVCEYGQTVQRAGAQHIVLRQADIPSADCPKCLA